MKSWSAAGLKSSKMIFFLKTELFEEAFFKFFN